MAKKARRKAATKRKPAKRAKTAARAKTKRVVKAKKAAPKKKVAKKPVAAKPAEGRLAHAWHTVVDVAKETQELREKLEPPGVSESE